MSIGCIIILSLATLGSWNQAIPETTAQDNESVISLTELENLPDTILLTARGEHYQADDLVLYNWHDESLLPLVTSDGSDGHATWSPDASQIAFQTDRDGNWEIYVLDVETQSEENLTHHPNSDMYPNWSPNGQVIHFSDRNGPAIWLTNPFDGEFVGLTNDDDCIPDYHPNFAPDGSGIAYRADCAGSGDIWWLDLASGERVNLTADSTATERYPAFSPDGNQILFVSNRDNNEEVYVMNADGTNIHNLTNHPAQDRQASWSPDGQFIIFISDREGGDDLWIMDADGGRQTLLLNIDDDLDWPWWQPMVEDEEMSELANADVEFVVAELQSNGTWRFTVTVRHPDTGWEDYADGWDVVLPDGTVVLSDENATFTRLLLHPHETEQPFTRSQSGLEIPEGITTVTVRAHDIVDGWGGQTVTLDLTQEAGDGFEVRR
jgi:TolB protein